MSDVEETPASLWERVVKAMRHPLRVALTLMVITLLIGPFASGWGLSAALFGVLLGLGVGEALGRSALRTEGIAGGAVGGLLLAWALSAAATRFGFVSWIVGPTATLHLASMLWFGPAVAVVIGGLRAAATRLPGLVVVELAALAAGFAVAFAPHREGAIARPLWLSDPAWKFGYDPGNVLLAVGGLFAAGLAMLLLLESKKRLSLAAAAVVPLVAILLFSLVDVRDLQQPVEVAELAEIRESVGEPPKPSETSGQGDDGQSTGETPESGESSGDKPQGAGEGGPEGEGTAGGDGEGGASPKGEGDGREGGGDGAAPKPGGELPDGEGTGDKPEEGGPGGDKPAEGAEGGAKPEGGKPEGEAGDEGDKPAGGSEGGKPPPEGGAAEESGDEAGDKGDPKSGDESEGEGEDKEGEEPEQPDEPEDSDTEEPEPPKEQPRPDDGEGQDSKEPSAPSPIAVLLLGDDYAPPSGGFYLRQEAHSEFNGLRLVPSTSVTLDRDALDHFPSRSEAVPDQTPTEGRKKVVGSVSLLVQHDMPFALEAPVSFEPRINPNPQRFVASYAFESWAQTLPYDELVGRLAGSPEWGEDAWALYTEIPPDQRYKDLADELVADLPDDVRDDPFAQALAIKVYLDENTKYTKAKRHEGVTDPTADYLFGDFEGYCVHTAHASVFLWRALGLPARVGTGYLVTEEARRGSALVVMGRDAHAWPEVYLEGIGWVVLDVAPQQVLDDMGLPADEDMIDLLAEMAREQPPEEVAVSRDWSGVRRVLKLGAITLISALVSTVVIVHWLIKLWRAVTPELASSAKLPRVGYRRALDLLLEAGFVRQFGETREAYARRVHEQLPALQRMTDWHVASALGPKGPPQGDAADPQAWRKALRNLRFELTAAAPLWRRVLGTLNPFSFYWSR